MNVLIIGINGFLGQELKNHLTSCGFDVYGTSHSNTMDKKIFTLQVGDVPVDEIISLNFSTIIYLAHSYEIKKNQLLVEWYQKLFLKFAPIVNKQIYLSSYSANKHAISHYGVTKYAIEQFFINNDGYAISPGLIIGNGGIYDRIYNFVNKSPLIIIPSNKKVNLLPIINVENVCFVIKQLMLYEYPTKNYNIFSEMITLEKLIQRIIHGQNKKKFLFKIDANFVLNIMKIAEFIKIKLPVTSDSLRGFIANQEYSTQSDLLEFTKKGNINVK
jgi:nucleoside-diphosphate-sugar epimerase